MRGRFASEGEFVPNLGKDGDDGYDTIVAIANETWCDGNIGMAGASYLGAAQWRAAQAAPPPLKAIAPHIVTPNRLFETQRAGGHDLKMTLGWSAGMAIETLSKLSARGKDVSVALRAAQDALADLDRACEFLPLNAMPFLESAGSHARRFDDQALKVFQSESEVFLDCS